MDAGEPGSRSIVAFLPFLVKGALSLSVLRAMHERGLDVTLAYHAPKEAHPFTPDLAEDFEVDGRLLNLSGMSREVYLDAIQDVIETRQVGLILQIGSPNYGLLPYIKERNSNVRIVDMLYNEVGHTVNHFLYENCMDGVVVESEEMRRFMERRSAKTNPGIVVLESGIDLTHFAPRPARPPRDGLVLGYVGRMSPEKNPIGFVNIAEKLAADHPALSFVMYGEGPISGEVKQQVDASQLGSRLRFEGYIGDLRDALAQIDALVVPSVTDGRPNIIMEANAFGLPVLAAPVGGIPELIENGRNGYLISPGDFDGMNAIIQSWEADPDVLAALSASAHQTARTRFDRGRMLDDYEAAFRGFLRH